MSKRRWNRMRRVGGWRPGCPLGRTGLRRLDFNDCTYDATIERGVMVVDRDIAPPVAEIFTEPFEKKLLIREERPVVAMFRERGWIRNVEVPDHMHFATGYRSCPHTSS